MRLAALSALRALRHLRHTYKDVGWLGDAPSCLVALCLTVMLAQNFGNFERQMLQSTELTLIGGNDIVLRLTMYSWLPLSKKLLLMILRGKCDSLLHVGVGGGRGKAQG